MYFIETRQLGLEPESARKDKLLKTQAGDISPYTSTRTHCDHMFKVQNFLVTVEAHRKTVGQAE